MTLAHDYQWTLASEINKAKDRTNKGEKERKKKMKPTTTILAFASHASKNAQVVLAERTRLNSFSPNPPEVGLYF